MAPALLCLWLAAAGDPVELRAESLQWDTRHERGTAEGQALLLANGAELAAQLIAYDRVRQLAWANGDVHGSFHGPAGSFELRGESVAIRLDGDQVVEVFAFQGVLEKTKGDRAGTRVSAEHLVREGGDWLVGDAILMPCACRVDEPVLTVTSSQASIDFDAERASLWFPTVRIHDVPVMWAPWLSLPLTSRQTGLLFPKPGFTGLNGLSFEQPFFLTLGPSFDLTFTPGYFGGSALTNGVQGPRLGTEFRYAPTTTLSGRATVGLLYDLKPPRDPVTGAPAATGTRGPRFEAGWLHRQDLEGGFRVRVDGAMVSDGYLFRDLTTDVLAREAGYLRSSASVAHVSEDTWLGLDAVLRQDLGFGFSVFPLPAASPALIQGPNPLQRLPAFTAAIPLRPLWGYLSGGVTAEWVRLAPTLGGSGDEGTLTDEGRPTIGGTLVSVECLRERLYWPNAPSPACPTELTPGPSPERGDRKYQAGEREARHRWMLLPRAVLSVPLFDLAQLGVTAAWRQAVYVGEVTGRTATFGYPVLGARLDTELARDFGTFRHTITPAVELRVLPGTVGTPGAPYDELDVAAPAAGRATQAVASIRQRLVRPAGELAMLEVGQGFDFTRGAKQRVAEAYARLRVRLGPVVLDGLGRLDPVEPRLTRGSASLGLDDGRGDGAYASYERLSAEGSGTQRAPVDLLFGSPAPGLSTGASQAVAVGGRLKLKDFRVRYDLLLGDRTFGPPGGSPVLTMIQHAVGVSWVPACDCLTIDVAATQRLDDSVRDFPAYRAPDLSASITIGNFGALGIAR